MPDHLAPQVCRACGTSGNGHYRSHCGQLLAVKTITLCGILRDVFHFFTHLDRGIGYTMKQLVIAPGHMQRHFIEGDRQRHQKPFAMFFICATIVALLRYGISEELIRRYEADIASEATFFHDYMVLTYIVLMPLYALTVWLLFPKAGYNYAEIGVLMLYTVSIFFLLAGLISFFKLIWPRLDTALIEYPVFVIYLTFTLSNFFRPLVIWKATVKSLIILAVAFAINEFAEWLVMRNL